MLGQLNTNSEKLQAHHLFQEYLKMSLNGLFESTEFIILTLLNQPLKMLLQLFRPKIVREDLRNYFFQQRRRKNCKNTSRSKFEEQMAP